MTDMQEKPDTSYSNDAQMPFHSLGQCADALLNAVAKGVEREVEPYGLTSREFSMMRLFLTDEEWTATELAKVLPVEVSAISRMVSKLVDKGLLSRRRPRLDRRIVLLKLTEEGYAIGLDIHRKVRAYEDLLTAGIEKEEMDAFQSVITKVVSNSSTMT